MATYEVTEGRGLPIGNITSQYFANLYLDGLDRMFRPYVRYMDDFVIWSNDKESLKCIKDKVVLYAKEKLSLTLKDFPFINRTSLGMDFFWMRIFPDKIHLSRRSCTRYLKKLRELEWAYNNWIISDLECQHREKAITAFAKWANSHDWRREKLISLLQTSSI